MSDPYNEDLARSPTNFQPLTPLKFLERAASVFPAHTAIIHGELRWSYAEFYVRSRQLASALSKHGIKRSDTVSVMAANTPAMLECHYGIPMCQAVLHAINTRLDAMVVAFQLDHADTKLLIVDQEFMPVVQKALKISTVTPLIIRYRDPQYAVSANGSALIDNGTLDYDDFIATGDPQFKWLMPNDEWDAISINYTSGTTGNPKGVVYHHRGAYLLAQGNALTTSMSKHAVYLWTLPMFHCNGWCFPWTISVVTGTHVCLRQVRDEPIWKALKDYRVTHLCGAPIVMSLIIAAADGVKRELNHVVQFFTAAAPPPQQVLADMKQAGFNVTHLYGLTEVYGPAVVNDWHSDWDYLPLTEQAALKSRQGVRYAALEELDVIDPKTMQPVARDGKTLGEVMFRGNVVMKGYFKNPEASAAAFAGGWFHSGDLGVIHSDGYIQLKDRSKDIIISGGENISSIEIEDVLYRHSSVTMAAVVAMPHTKWGEVPCAFVELSEGEKVTDDDLRAWCLEELAGFKVPKKFVFTKIPQTTTGKIQKFILRDKARAFVIK